MCYKICNTRCSCEVTSLGLQCLEPITIAGAAVAEFFRLLSCQLNDRSTVFTSTELSRINVSNPSHPSSRVQGNENFFSCPFHIILSYRNFCKIRLFESGHRESNPDILLGKQIGYHYIMAAFHTVSLFSVVSHCYETGLKSETQAMLPGIEPGSSP